MHTFIHSAVFFGAEQHFWILYPDTHTVHHKYSTVIYALVQLKRGKKEAVGGQWGLRILDLWPLLWIHIRSSDVSRLVRGCVVKTSAPSASDVSWVPHFFHPAAASLVERETAGCGCFLFFFKYNYTLQYVHCVIIVSHAAALYSRCVFAKEEPNKIRRNLPAFFFFRREATSEHSFYMV